MFGTGGKKKKASNEQSPGRDGLEEDADHLPAAVLERMKRSDEQSQRALDESSDETEDVSKEEIVIHLSNWLAWCIFQDCSTQWRTSMNGAVGLDYNVVFRVMESYKVRNELSTLRRVKLIENGALAGFKGTTREEIGVF